MTKLFLLITKHIRVLQMSDLSAGMTISHISYASYVSPIINIVVSLQNLLHVPLINKNLLSLSKFTHDNNFFFEFYHDSCSVKHQATKQVLFQCTFKNGIYVFPAVRSSPYFANYTSFKFEKLALHLWNNRLRHCSFHAVRNILNQCSITCTAKPGFCDACVQKKAVKRPFSSSTLVYTFP